MRQRDLKFTFVVGEGNLAFDVVEFELEEALCEPFRHDTRSHNPVLYQLSYAHHIVNRAGRSGFNRSGRTSRA